MDNSVIIEYVDIDSITPYARNAKLHPREQIEQIKKSIEEFGFNDPLAIWHGEIVEGHGRLMAAKELGYEKLPVIRLDNLTDEQRRAYALVHNKLTMNSDFDMEVLSLELGDIDLDMGDFGFALDTSEEPAEAVDDDYDPEPPNEPKSKRGDIYQLGRHRLMCGDSTDAQDVDTLMDGAKADMVFTDPPYGVDYKGINNDSRSGLEQLLNMAFENAREISKDGASVYCFHSDKCADIFHYVFRRFCHFSSMIIWEKESLVLSQGDYQSIHEPCLYGWFDNGTHNFYGDRKQTTVWKFARQSVEGHTTPKPIGFICKALENSSKDGENVFDCFGGSGSTLIACEQLDRRCYMMELDPRYVDVIIDRWETFTGEKAVLING